VVEEMSGRSFDQFFEQWVYRAQQPALDVNYSWDAKAKLAKVTVKQVQKISEDVSLFRFPLTLRFKGKGTTTDKTFEVREKEHDFFVALKDAPEIVRVDPEFTLLAKVNFKPANAMLLAQLADKSDMIGRVLAAEQLGEKGDSAGIAKLKDALQHDAFFGVRLECAKALKKAHSDEARDALLASLAQPDAQARNAVVEGIAGFFDPKAREALLRVTKIEKNPVVAASAVRALGKYNDDDTRAALRTALASDSYRQRIADAAVVAIREQDQSTSLDLLRETVQSRGKEFSSSSLAGALDAFASVARPLTDKSPSREFLKGYLADKKERVRTGAIRALGTLSDEAAIPLLEPFAAGAKDSPEQKEAEAVLAKLRGAQKPGDNLKDLRKELLDVKDDNRKLRKEFDELKKKIEAAKP
ncbi:MAG: HEAT repeat domain-containing protein, partial [Verrucomicrobia bacterium]|nr:HEAT repeat domain-containing protein [Verrucomicrobiota bacterium]